MDDRPPSKPSAESIAQRTRRRIDADELATLKVRVLDLTRAGATWGDIRAVLGIRQQQVIRWGENDPAFAAASAQARLDGAGANATRRHEIALEQIARARAAKAAKDKRNHVLERRRACRLRLKAGIRVAAGPWSAEEDALVRRHAGTLCWYELLALINALRSPAEPQRTRGALVWRVRLLGLGLAPVGRMTATDLKAFFGSSQEAVNRHIVRAGAIPYARNGTVQGCTLSFWPDDVARLLREQPWLYDPASLAPGRLGDVGRLAHRADPWFTLREAAEYLGYSTRGTMSTFRRRALPGLPLKVRHLGGPTGGSNVYVVRRRDLVAYAAGQMRRGA